MAALGLAGLAESGRASFGTGILVKKARWKWERAGKKCTEGCLLVLAVQGQWQGEAEGAWGPCERVTLGLENGDGQSRGCQ